MLPYSDPVASIIPAMSLDSTSDNAMTALSRLALGPVNSKHYLPIFERFDDTGRTTTTWNWTACLFTLNWMVFRQLWGAALVYVAAAEGLALVVLGLGRSLLQWPQGVEWGVLGTVALMAFAVPGLYGDAILYADIRKRVARALAASRTVPDACALLEKQASSRKRLQMLVMINVVLIAGAGLIYLMLPSDGAKPLGMEPSITVAQATAAAATGSAAKASAAAGAVVAAAPQASVAAPASANAASDTSPQETQPLVPAPVPTPAPAAVPKAPAQAITANKSAAQKAAPPAQSTASSSTRTPAAAPAKTSSEPTPRHAAASRGTQKAKSKTPAPAASPASASASASASTTPTDLAKVGSTSGYYINVGLFADQTNARKAQARLLNEGLPAFRQELNDANGRRIRVRVGPYDSRAKADAAARAIRAMSLEAVIFKK